MHEQIYRKLLPSVLDDHLNIITLNTLYSYSSRQVEPYKGATLGYLHSNTWDLFFKQHSYGRWWFA